MFPCDEELDRIMCGMGTVFEPLADVVDIFEQSISLNN